MSMTIVKWVCADRFSGHEKKLNAMKMFKLLVKGGAQIDPQLSEAFFLDEMCLMRFIYLWKSSIRDKKNFTRILRFPFIYIIKDF